MKSNKIIYDTTVLTTQSANTLVPKKPCPQLIEDLNNWKHKIVAILYLRRVETPNILAELQSTKMLVIQVTIPTRVLRDYRFVQDLVRVHPSYLTELKLPDIIVRNQRILRKQIQKWRTH